MTKGKVQHTNIESAFLKTNTKMQLISIGLPNGITSRIHSKTELKIKLEIDIDPPPGLSDDSKDIAPTVSALGQSLHHT